MALSCRNAHTRSESLSALHEQCYVLLHHNDYDSLKPKAGLLLDIAIKENDKNFIAAEVNFISDGTPSLAWMTVCTLIPPFFFPVFG